jgi:CheY-like chemotaxis protein/anti-sigma regulatory factor (Ser/Thr protein kinase)
MARILVVDDALMDLRLASKLLERNTEWTVACAQHGREALERVESDLPDLVVTDLQMPGMSGLELVEVMRTEFPLIPVVLMTAAGSEEIAVEALRRGAASYVPKRELAADLVDTVARLLASSAEQRNRRRLLNHLTELHYVLANDLDLLSAFVSELRQLIRDRYLLDDNNALRFATAVDEALANAYFHGNLEVSSSLRAQDASLYHALATQRLREQPYCERQIHIQVRIDKVQISVTVRDEGQGFDPGQLPDPTAPGYLERPCGRGILLMRSFADDVQFSDAGNEVTMFKHLLQASDDHVLASDDAHV